MGLKTVDIKGKSYVEVAERIKYFRNNYPKYRIETTLLSNDNGVCVFKAEVKDLEGTVFSTGHAYEKEGSSFINKTSYIENCETSAIGRALGIFGIGIDAGIASADEVINADAPTEYISQEQVLELEGLINETNSAREKVLSYLKVDSLDKLPKSDYNKAKAALVAKKGQAK